MHTILITKKVPWIIPSCLLILLLAGSCKKFIEVPPPTTSITEANVFSNDQTSIAAVTGLFARISQGGYAYGADMSLHFLSIPKLAGLSADELDLWSGAPEVERAYYENNLQTHFQGSVGSIEAGSEFWNWLYPMVYSANQTLENLERSSNLTPNIRQQLSGECQFYRAFLYFYLVNLYGDVPLVLGTSPETNRKLKRVPVPEVYAQIIADLTEAKSMLSENFVNNGLQPYTAGIAAERTRPNRWAATALMARTCLFIGDYAKAAEAATEVINQSSLFELARVPLTAVFKKNSREAIWQLQPVYIGVNTPESRMFVLNAAPIGFNSSKTVYLSQSLLQAFEAGDARRTLWVDSYASAAPVSNFYFPYKYTDAANNTDITPETGTTLMTEYSMVLRLAEQYLIRAEARARIGNLADAIADLNVVRTRARALPTSQVPDPLPKLPTNLNQQQVLQAVWQEKRVELFAEWGHRWLDLKRTGQINTVMEVITQQKGGSWQPTDPLYPLPAIDLHRAPQLTQNPGY